jgi:hypothetical protein
MRHRIANILTTIKFESEKRTTSPLILTSEN